MACLQERDDLYDAMHWLVWLLLQQSGHGLYFEVDADLYVRMYTRTTHVEVRTFTEELLFFTSIVEHKEYAN